VNIKAQMAAALELFKAGKISRQEFSTLRRKIYAGQPKAKLSDLDFNHDREFRVTSNGKPYLTPAVVIRLRRIFDKAKAKGKPAIKRAAKRLGMNYSTFVNIGNRITYQNIQAEGHFNE